MAVLQQGSTGPQVTALQTRLKALGFDPKGIDGNFGPGTKAAVMAFQRSKGLQADGVVGPQTAAALQASGNNPSASVSAGVNTGSSGAGGASTMPIVTVAEVSQMFPGTPVLNIQTNLPFVLQALAAAGMGDKQMILMALATIRAETGNFTPLSEFQSKFNTPPGGPPFSLYDNRHDLGNQGPPDGANFRGRGYVQLTGRSNYQIHGAAIGLGNQLITNPQLANQPGIAAKLLASFLKSKEQAIRNALAANNLALARKLVNGGSHGLAEFTQAYQTGLSVIP